MPCTQVTVGTGTRVGGDKFYDCVDGKCVEKVGGQYKNDPKCGGKCEEKKPTDWVSIAIIGGTIIAAAALLLQATGKK